MAGAPRLFTGPTLALLPFSASFFTFSISPRSTAPFLSTTPEPIFNLDPTPPVLSALLLFPRGAMVGVPRLAGRASDWRRERRCAAYAALLVA